MGKRLIVILALAFVVGIAFTAYAEVQNVKVSGDITALSIYRNNLDLAKPAVSGAAIDGFSMTNANSFDDKTASLASIARLRVDADLTDNVAATVRLLNEREWNGDVLSTGIANTNIGLNNSVAAINSVAATLDLAYVTLKEFLYSPLTLKVGRQELNFNTGFIIGDPDTNGFSNLTALTAGDLSAHKAFDAVRATLDYSPLVIDILYAKPQEGSSIRNDDITFSGINISTPISKTTLVEGFLYSRVIGSGATGVVNVDVATTLVNTAFDGTSTNKQKADKVHTVGAHVTNMSINNLILDIIGAFQFGTYNPKFDVNARYQTAALKAETANRRAFAGQFVAIYNLKDIAAISKYHPVLTGVFQYLSGENRDRIGNKTYHGWDPNFEDQTFGHLVNAMTGQSNSKTAGLRLEAKPTDDLTAKLDYVGFWLNKKFPEGRLVNLSGVQTARNYRMSNKSFFGQEVDLNLTYAYTEDVQFSLLGGIFFPSAINSGSASSEGLNVTRRAKATELIGSMKVTF